MGFSDYWSVGAGLFQGLLGGEEGGYEKTSTLDKNQQAIYDKLTPFVKSRIGEGLPAWKGEWVAGPSEYEQMGLSKLGEYMQGGLSSTTQFGLGQYKQALAGLSPQETIDWYNQYIAPEERRIQAEEVIPGVREAYVGTGNYAGSPRMNAEAQSWGQYGTQKASRLGQAIMSERESARSMLPYLGQMEALETELPLRQAQAGMQYGALPRQIEQQELTAQFEEFKRTSPELSPILDLALQLMNTTTQAVSYTPYQPSETMQLLQAFAPAVGSYYGAKAGG